MCLKFNIYKTYSAYIYGFIQIAFPLFRNKMYNKNCVTVKIYLIKWHKNHLENIASYKILQIATHYATTKHICRTYDGIYSIRTHHIQHNILAKKKGLTLHVNHLIFFVFSIPHIIETNDIILNSLWWIFM